jgi:DNA-directed RNA polymerase subunit RPC12/RpoP
VAFEQAAEELIVKDVGALESIKAGPDIHCPFCGTRNSASAAICSRCGGDLKEGKRRESGKVLGAHRDKPAPDIICESCGTPNRATRRICANCGATLKQATPVAAVAAPAPTPSAAASLSRLSPLVLLGIGLLLLLVCGALAFFLTRTEAVVGRVTDVEWIRRQVILGFAPAEHSDWSDEIPAEAEVTACSERLRERSSEPVANAQQVCGTPYTIDQGTGFGEVVQDCEYLVYDDYCEYTVIELQPVDVVTLSGDNLNPQWPAVQLQQDQQLGEREEQYQVLFTVDGRQYSYETSDPALFTQFSTGSDWQLEINSFNNIVSVEPVP